MAKKKNKNKPGRKQFVPIEGGTMLERFRKLEARNMGKPPASEVVPFISVENARITTPDLSEEDIQECRDFTKYFMRKYGENRDIMDAIDQNWPQEPRVFRMARGDDPKNVFTIQAESLQKVAELFKFIMQLRRDHTIIIVDIEEYHEFDLLGMMRKRDYAQDAYFVQHILFQAFGRKEAVLGICTKGRNGQKDILYGFLLANGQIQKMTPHELQLFHEQEEDGTIVPDPNIEYKYAPVKL